MKVHAVYAEPFWRAAGLTGQAVSRHAARAGDLRQHAALEAAPGS